MASEPARIALRDDGVEIFGDNPGSLPWAEIVEIVVFKADLFTEDLVCMELIHSHGVFHVNEDAEGFWELVARVKEVFPESDQKWEDQVIKPAFVENRTNIYRRQR